jgi:predicted Zn-dependent protease
MRRATELAEFHEDVVGYVAATLPLRPLFHNATHPDGALLALLLRGALRQLADLVPADGAAALVETVARLPGLNLESWHPLPEETLRRLGFRWTEDPAYAHWQAAKAAFDRGAFAEAAEQATRSLSHARSGYLFLLLSRAQARLGRHDEAIRAVEEALAFFPLSPILKLHLIDQLLKKADFAAARSLAEAMVREQPELPIFKMQLSKALAGEGRMEEALAIAAAASSRPRARVEVFAHHVGLLIAAGQLDEAAAICRRGLEKHPGNPMLTRQAKQAESMRRAAPAAGPAASG